MRVVTNGIRADPRPRCGGLFGSVRGVCLFGHNDDVVSVWGDICDVSHQIGENVSGAIYVEAPLNQVDAF